MTVLLDGKKGRAKVFVIIVDGVHIVDLGGELCEVFVFEGMFGGYAFIGVIGQEFGEYVFEVLSAACG